MTTSNIESCTPEDIPEIFKLYEEATAYQKLLFPENHWPHFEDALVRKEVTEKRQFKLIIGEDIACVWAITFSDPDIWEATSEDDSVFIHRIAVNPNYRGKQLVKHIVAWAKTVARTNEKSFIRMDTCGENHRLIAHYKNCGFSYLGMKILKEASRLPSHYHNVPVCFFEINLDRIK